MPRAAVTRSISRRIQLWAHGDWLPDYPAPLSYLPQYFGVRDVFLTSKRLHNVHYSPIGDFIAHQVWQR